MNRIVSFECLGSIDFPQVHESTSNFDLHPKSAHVRFPVELFTSCVYDTFCSEAFSSNWFGLHNLSQYPTPYIPNTSFAVSRCCGRLYEYLLAITSTTKFCFNAGNRRVDGMVTEMGQSTENLVYLQTENRWDLDNMPTSSKMIVEVYSHFVQDHKVMSGYPEWIWVIGQCVGLLCHYRRRFCILHTLAFFYVIHIVDIDGVAQVHISNRFSCAADKTRLRNGKPCQVHLESPQRDAIPALVVAHLAATGLSAVIPKLHSSELVYSLCFIYALHIGIRSSNLICNPPFALPSCPKGSVLFNGHLTFIDAGGSGCVYSGMLNGTKVAFKFAEIRRNWKEFDPDALDAELRVYQQYSDLQGRYLPRIIESSVVSGNAQGFCMELLSPLSSWFKDWTEEQRCEAAALLHALLDVGLWQNDIRAANFGVNSQGRIVMIDLEDCSVIGLKDHARRMRCIKSIDGLYDDLDDEGYYC